MNNRVCLNNGVNETVQSQCPQSLYADAPYRAPLFEQRQAHNPPHNCSEYPYELKNMHG
jgi:hypothetical protein